MHRSGLLDVLERVLDKGIVIEEHVRRAPAGIALARVDARVRVCSIETHLVACPRRPAAEPGIGAIDAYLREMRATVTAA